MASTFWDKITGFPVAAATTAARPSRLEEEVVSLFDQLRVPVLRYLLSFRVPAPDAEEIVQEVFLLLFQHLRQGKSAANLQGWVFKVAHNLALKHHTRARRHSDRFSHLALSEVAGDVSPGPDERMEVLERQQRLLAVVRAMPEQDQCCLSLRAEGLRYRNIAEILGISLGSVANSLERSLSRLARADY
ncbi:MAG: sigma-70 family RNA polymerase sigma factor [Bryobacteraceae bacterium]|jgi:RNA polymerase sigma-70 factor (ECF subfamily)